jgi:DNA-binding transcriptional ArsR family regulator
MDLAAMKALGEETRLRIAALLSERAYCVSALAAKLGLSVPAVSQHLRVLSEAGIVTGVQFGHHKHYRLERDKLNRLAGDLRALGEERPSGCRDKSRRCDVSDAVGCKRKPQGSK